MLTFVDSGSRGGRLCDGMSRRDFLTVGGISLGGLMLPGLLRAEAEQGIRSSHKSLIHIFLPGGPPHQDLWDLKPDAPENIRGEFKPISTNVAGIQICELLPEMAKLADKLVFVRSIVGAQGPHYAVQCLTGRTQEDAPSLGAWVSRIEGPAHSAVPPHLSMFYRTRHAPWGDAGGGGFLGDAHAPFGLVDSYEPGHKADDPSELAPDAGPLAPKNISMDRLRDRRTLLQSLDRLRRRVETSDVVQSRDHFTNQAWEILTSRRLVDALDISKEDPKIVARYGDGSAEYNADSAPRISQNVLIARRLVEAGARVVSLNFSRWDWHGRNFEQGRTEFPRLDKMVSALVRDLHERGLDRDVTVLVWGEFGRTPKINETGGRDHWPAVNSAVLACGGMRTGQVIGATDKHAAEVVDRPVTFADVHATVYHNLGIDPHMPVADRQGRIHYPVDRGAQPIAELI